MKNLLPLLACLLLLTGTPKAQPYYFRHYQVENGLSHNSVFCSAQDKNGFLWFGTKDGLSRFDGYRFKTYHISTEKNGTLTGDLILTLATNRQGTLWVGSQKGLFFFDAEKEQFLPFLDSLHGINKIYFDRSGRLWFLADNTLNCYDFRTKKATEFLPEKYFNATSLCEAADGTMWVSTTDGYLQRYDADRRRFQRFNVFDHSPRAESRWIHNIVFDPQKGSILIGTTNQGLKEFSLSAGDYRDLLTYNPNKTTIYVRDILLMNDEEIWVATESGIFIVNRINGQWVNLKKKHLDPYSLSDNAVYTLFKDTEGGIWAGTFFGGLNYYPRQLTAFQKFFPDFSQNSISGNAVREICEDRTGTIWIGTEDAGLNKLEPRTGKITHFEPTGRPGSIAYSNVHGLLAVEDKLWIGTFEHGLDIMDLHSGKVVRHYGAGGPNSLPSNFIITFLRTRSGAIYLGTSSGVCRYNPTEDNFSQPKGLDDGSFVPCLLEDHEGMIWVATHNRGLYGYNPVTGAIRRFGNEPGNENSLSANSINSLYEDSDHNLWLSLEGGGLCRLDRSRKQFTRYSTRNGLPSNFVFKVLEDEKKKLWVTTAKGLVSLEAQTGKISVYRKADGLLNDQFNYNSGYKDRQGNLYFGSVQGMIKFNPLAFQPNRFVPPVFITGFQVQNKEIEAHDSSFLQQSILYTEQITLPYDQSSFSIDFAALAFTAPETSEYSYRMSGLDKEWTFLHSNRKVYFTNLKPGTYTFQVRAGSGGTWNQHAKALTILITPPLWATPWAYLAYVLAIGVLIYYAILTYLGIQENKKQKEIYQAKMEFFSNIAHEIKTPLTLIKGPVENLSELAERVPDIREEVHTMERNTNRLISLMNQILDFRQTETRGFSLDFTDVALHELLQEAYETFQPVAAKKHLHYTLELPPSAIRCRADVEALTKVFHNLFSNAVKYADKEVSARLVPPSGDDTHLVFEIRNDGPTIPRDLQEKVFEPFFRIKESNKQKGTGLGLALARSLVELHEGKIYIKETEREGNLFVVELPHASTALQRKNTRNSNQIAGH